MGEGRDFVSVPYEAHTEEPVNLLDISISPHQYNNIIVTIDSGANERELPPFKDDTSIAAYGERKLRLAMPLLTRHQHRWGAWVANKLLTRFKNPRYRVSLTLKSTFHASLAQNILLRDNETDFLDVVQILQNTQDRQNFTTRIVAETL